MKAALPCGRKEIHIRLPDRGDDPTLLETLSPAELKDPKGAVARSLEDPIGSPSLADLAQGRGNACVVVSDITRPVPNRDILPPLLQALESAGLPKERTVILVATGMHRPNTEAELVSLLGSEVVRRYRIVNHDCRDRSGLTKVMELRGRAVELNRIYLEADLKILTGLIEPHPFAGFSGGAKSILPGLASFETMKFMHSFAMIDNPRVANARLEDNPFREYVDLVGRSAGLDFLVNVIIDKAKKTTAVFAGDPISAHRAGCLEAGKHSVVRIENPGDLVVTTGGGFPLDTTLYQSSKGLAAVRDMIRPGGTILWVAGCEEGLGGEEFRKLVGSVSGPEEFRARYSRAENFVVDQWGAQVYYQVLEKAGEILLFCPNLTQEQVDPFGLTMIRDPQTIVDRFLEKKAKVIINPEGPYLVGWAGG